MTRDPSRALIENFVSLLKEGGKTGDYVEKLVCGSLCLGTRRPWYCPPPLLIEKRALSLNQRIGKLWTFISMALSASIRSLGLSW